MVGMIGAVGSGDGDGAGIIVILIFVGIVYFITS